MAGHEGVSHTEGEKEHLYVQESAQNWLKTLLFEFRHNVTGSISFVDTIIVKYHC